MNLAAQTTSKLKRSRPKAPRPTTQMFIGLVAIPLMVAAIVIGVYFYVRADASDTLIIPDRQVLLVRTLPDETAPLMARFGRGRTVTVTGRTQDWRWLEIELWDGRHGWALRPLDVLVWQLEAEATTPGETVPPWPEVVPLPADMIAIAATSFTMGSPPGLGEADERPAHPVSLSAFSIDRTEVTVGQYWDCVLAGVCAAPTQDRTLIDAHFLNNPVFDNYPVVYVPWPEANSYCGWRGKRLPTEAEWEMAAGWNDIRKAKLLWPWGNTPDPSEVNVATQVPMAVGSQPADASPAGVLDMGGNVSEWVFDWYKVDYYEVADNSDPLGPTHRRGEGSGRVVRGGSFADPVDAARVANRRHQAENYGYPTVGFRCAQDSR